MIFEFFFPFISTWLSRSYCYDRDISGLTRFYLDFFCCFFLIKLIFLSSFNIRSFDNWVSWYYSICFQTWLLSKRFCMLIRVCSNRVFSIFFLIILFLNFYPSTFYLLEIELQLFFLFNFFYLWTYHVFIWFIKNYPSNFFSCFFFYEIISILCLWSQCLRVNPVIWGLLFFVALF